MNNKGDAMKRFKASIVCVTVVIVFSMILGSSLCIAEELSSVKIKRIKDAIEKLEDPARSVQRKGYKDIKYIGTATVPYLVKELKRKDIGFESLVLICDILGEYKAKDAVPGLLYDLKHQSYSVQAAACKALGNIGDPVATEPLMKMLKSDEYNVRKEAIDALIHFDDANIPPMVAEFLNDENEEVRRSAVILLDSKLDPATAGAVRKAMSKDKSGSIRMLAARTLGNLTDREAVDILTEAVTEDPVAGVRQETVIALGKIGDKKTVPVLIEALKDDYKDVQLSAANSLITLTGEDYARDHAAWVAWYEQQGEY
jgi:HEAT repeat protein